MVRMDYECREVEEKIVCPYCYEECEDYDYSVIRHCSNHSTKYHCWCPNCKKEFLAFGETVCLYTTSRIDDDGNEVEYWDNEYLDDREDDD